MRTMTSEELHNAMEEALAEVDRQLASGELDQSGRFWTDEELARMKAEKAAAQAASAPAA